MPQDQDFGFQLPSRLEAVAQHTGEEVGNCDHAAIMFCFAADRGSNGWNFRKRQLWFAVTRNPTAEWLARQIMEAFPWDTAPNLTGARQRRCLRRGIPASGSDDGNPRPTHITEIALAEPIC